MDENNEIMTEASGETSTSEATSPESSSGTDPETTTGEETTTGTETEGETTTEEEEGSSSGSGSSSGGSTTVVQVIDLSELELVTGQIYETVDHPFMTTPIDEFTVSEGLLLTILVVLVLDKIRSLLKEGFYWLL